MTEIIFIDLFSGIGGFAEGFRRAGVKFKYHAFSEIDKNAISIYKKHFPDAKELGNVATIRDFSEIREQRRGGQSRLSSLSAFLVKIYRLLESNEVWKAVEAGCSMRLCGLFAKSDLIFLSLRTSKAFCQVTEEKTLSDVCGRLPTLGIMTVNGNLSILLGYYPRIESECTLSELLEDTPESKYFLSDAAKNRLMGYNKNRLTALEPGIKNQQEVDRMLLNVNGINKLNSPTEKTVLYKVPHGYCSGGIKESDVCDTVTASSFQNNNFIIPVLTPDRENKRQMGRRFKNAGDPAFTITTQDRHGISDGIHIRRLTPLECERLQGFPDGWTAEGADGKKISDSARYKALGNAVSVCFPELIAKALFEE